MKRVEAVAVLLVALWAGTAMAQEAGTRLEFAVDYTKGGAETNAALDFSGVMVHPDRRCVVFQRPGSELKLSFALPAAPQTATLELTHLSSMSGQAALQGQSPVTVAVNGQVAARDLDPGAHGFTTDRLTVTKYLRAGGNTVTLTAGSGSTRYWLQALRVICQMPPGTPAPAPVARREGQGEYMVVVSEDTYGRPEWAAVVAALQAKHGGGVIVHPGSVGSAREGLREVRPRYVAFVARPEEMGRSFVAAVNQMTRALDDDPYGDALWGVITGYEAADALRIAQRTEPLRVKRAAGGCGVDLDGFAEGAWYSEGEQGVMWEKKPGGKPEKATCAPDTTEALAREISDNNPGLFATSGHATPRDWQIGYSYPNGQFRCQGGQLFGLDTHGQRFDITSPGPRVYCPLGNCLMGLVEDREAMALAWMHSAGVYQMAGYSVLTWYGTAHSIYAYLVGSQGGYSFAESCFLNSQFTLRELETRFPEAARLSYDTLEMETDGELVGRFAEAHGIGDRDALGLLWDRDTLVFYGDPAWEARVEAVREPAWRHELTERDGHFVFEVRVPVAGEWSRPPAALLPYRVQNVRVTAGAELNPLITDDFIMVPLTGKHAAGEVFRVEFDGDAVGSGPQ